MIDAPLRPHTEWAHLLVLSFATCEVKRAGRQSGGADDRA